MNPYKHAEAFCIMRYQSRDGHVVEYIWNSRDGVTPFCIRAKDGKTELEHVCWNRDERRPDHKPMPGDRIFVDLTPEKAREYRRQQWDDPRNKAHLSARYSSFEEFADSFTIRPGDEPDIVTVTKEGGEE